MNPVVNVYHADGGEPARIAALEEIPTVLNTDQALRMFRDQGQILGDALIDSLPGGTLDMLLVRLLEHRASLFRVPFHQGETE